jgi:hypothetical protein
MEMRNSIFMRVSSLFRGTGMNLLAQGSPMMGQARGGQQQMGSPQMGRPQMGASSGQELEAFSLPKGTITENDIPQIKTVIQQALDKLSESRKTAGKRSDNQAIKSGILAFQDWLKKQGCVVQASTTYDIEATERYSENIFVSYPGQLPFDVVFKMSGESKKQYRLLIFVTAVDLFSFASLVENKSIGGVPALKNWPSSYLEKRPEI